MPPSLLCRGLSRAEARGTGSGPQGDQEKGSWECRLGSPEPSGSTCLQGIPKRLLLALLAAQLVLGCWPRKGRLGMSLSEDGEAEWTPAGGRRPALGFPDPSGNKRWLLGQGNGTERPTQASLGASAP